MQLSARAVDRILGYWLIAAALLDRGCCLQELDALRKDVTQTLIATATTTALGAGLGYFGQCRCATGRLMLTVRVSLTVSLVRSSASIFALSLVGSFFVRRAPHASSSGSPLCAGRARCHDGAAVQIRRAV